eukprot:1887061-Lingulodinium_polyedra.AAC.1
MGEGGSRSLLVMRCEAPRQEVRRFCQSFEAHDAQELAEEVGGGLTERHEVVCGKGPMSEDPAVAVWA